MEKVRINREVGIDIYTLLYINRLTNKGIHVAQGTQYSVMTYMGK